MRTLACEPCAKRKVRCDREEPCSNCKRRKKDHCTYPELSPSERIKHLETIVRSLGGDPESNTHYVPPPHKVNLSVGKGSGALHLDNREVSPAGGRSRDPVILEEDGQQFYLESRAWHSWLGNAPNADTYRKVGARNPFMTRNHPNAFERILCSRDTISLASGCPPQRDADILWNAFHHRVYPLVRISFSWALKDLQNASIHPERQELLTDAQYALLFSIYLISIVSLSEEDCVEKFHQQKSILFSSFQMLCEEALSRTNLFCIMDITVMKALTIYMMAGVERLSTQSLWSLMGLIIRNAEKLGIHRDGTFLGLSPFVTEERRRLWWQLQHLDLALAVRSGLTPLTLMADWDSRLPLNVEDGDISVEMTDFPHEREGLTSMSYCLYTYKVLDRQRTFFQSQKGRFELSWQSNKSLPQSLKQDLITQLQDNLNKDFLQFCDPIKPLDTLIQISARALVCGMRERSLQTLVNAGQSGVPEEEHHREELIKTCMQSIRYNIALHSSSTIRHFQWLTRSFFSWHSFMCVLVELSQQKDAAKTQAIWDLLSDLYAINPTISDLADDRRNFHAAELVVAAWKAEQNKSDSNQLPPKPEFVARLERQLSNFQTVVAPNSGTKLAQQGNSVQGHEPITPQSLLVEQGMGFDFDLDFQDIDWSFWSSID